MNKGGTALFGAPYRPHLELHPFQRKKFCPLCCNSARHQRGKLTTQTGPTQTNLWLNIYTQSVYLNPPPPRNPPPNPGLLSSSGTCDITGDGWKQKIFPKCRHQRERPLRMTNRTASSRLIQEPLNFPLFFFFLEQREKQTQD